VGYAATGNHHAIATERQARGVSYSKAHLWRLERAGKFPRRVKLTPNGINYWRDDELDAFLAQRSADRWRPLGEVAAAVVDKVRP